MSHIMNYVDLRATVSALLGPLISLDRYKLLHVGMSWGCWWEGVDWLGLPCAAV